jgi:hypothetical protein
MPMLKSNTNHDYRLSNYQILSSNNNLQQSNNNHETGRILKLKVYSDLNLPRYLRHIDVNFPRKRN